MQTDTFKCDPLKCEPPTCRCPAYTPPGDLPLEEVPQFVMVSGMRGGSTQPRARQQTCGTAPPLVHHCLLARHPAPSL